MPRRCHVKNVYRSKWRAAMDWLENAPWNGWRACGIGRTGLFSDPSPSDHMCTPPSKCKSELKDSIFSEVEIQDVWIHHPFIRVPTISYRNGRIVMKTYRKIIGTQMIHSAKIMDPERSYRRKSYAYKIIRSEKSSAENNTLVMVS